MNLGLHDPGINFYTPSSTALKFVVERGGVVRVPVP